MERLVGREPKVAIERTLCIIKPDAVAQNYIGAILGRCEQKGLRVVAAKMLHMTDELAGGFYAEHTGKPFFAPLLGFMTSGPVVVAVLEGENAVAAYRELMGTTNPEDAAPETLRADFATNMRENAVHGSDSLQSAAREIGYFFKDAEICPRTR